MRRAERPLTGKTCFCWCCPRTTSSATPGVFARAVARAAACAAEGRLVTFGIEPGGPETGYGYIQRGDALATGFAVRRFVEKPRRDAAEAMLADGGYYWNSGMFLFRPRPFWRTGALRSGHAGRRFRRLARAERGAGFRLAGQGFCRLPGGFHRLRGNGENAAGGRGAAGRGLERSRLMEFRVRGGGQGCRRQRAGGRRAG